MKVFILLLFCLSNVLCWQHYSTDTNWAKFKVDFGKNYSLVDDLEEESRYTAYIRSRKVIKDCNAMFRKGKTSFRCTINRYADLTSKDIRIMSNSLRNEGDVDTSEWYRMYNSSLESCIERCIPPSWNWVAEYPDMDVVLDQGEVCGSCYAFVTAAAIEAHNYIHNGGNFIKLSEQQIVDCSAAFGNHKCVYGAVQTAYNYFISDINVNTGKYRPIKGAMAEADYEYAADNSKKCYYRPKKAKVFLRGYMGIPPNENALMVAIARFGPVAAAMDASLHSFHFYSKGIYDDPRCESNKTTHSVLIVGYGREGNKDYWIIKNSWGRDWGVNGYGRVLRNGQNFCGLLNTLIVPIIDREKTNTGAPSMTHVPSTLENCRKCMKGNYHYFGQITPIKKVARQIDAAVRLVDSAVRSLNGLPYVGRKTA